MKLDVARCLLACLDAMRQPKEGWKEKWDVFYIPAAGSYVCRMRLAVLLGLWRQDDAAQNMHIN